MIKTEKGIELKNKLLAGIRLVADAVSSTLGPSGRNVLINNGTGPIRITKDGVTVASSIKEVEDPIENTGVQLIKQVSVNAADKAGDGTTTSTLLASVMVEEGIKLITQGVNPIEVQKGIQLATREVVDYLKSISKEITKDQLIQVASLSANNDYSIGKLISEALNAVGRDGLVTIEDSKTGDTKMEIVEGIQFDRGWKSMYFVTNNTTMQTVYNDTKILIYNGKDITSMQEIVPLLERIQAGNKSLLIIADEIEGQALGGLLLNKGRTGLKTVAVKAPDYGEKRTHILEDIAIMTGGTVLNAKVYPDLSKVNFDTPGILGEARSITVTKDQTTIVDGKGDIKLIETRILDIKDQIDKAESQYERERLQDRLSKMVGGIAIIHVGALSDVEMKEKKDRIDDALHATKAAILEGVIPGGGMGFMMAANELKREKYSVGSDQNLGRNIVLKAIQAPFKKILLNAGIENHHEIFFGLPDKDNGWQGYNVKTNQYENFLQTGVLDPTKVTRVALENASSVAGTILTTESVVYEKKEEKKDAEQDYSNYM